MSLEISKQTKVLRILLISIFLGLFVGAIIFYYSEDLLLSTGGFLASLFYFIAIMWWLTATKNIHFPVTISKKEIKDVYFESNYKSVQLKSVRVMFIAAVLFLMFAVVYYTYQQQSEMTVGLLILTVFIIYYFTNKKIEYYVTKQGIIFNYGQFIVLLKWNEIKGIKVHDSEAELLLENKKVKRKLIVNDILGFEWAVKKLGHKII